MSDEMPSVMPSKSRLQRMTKHFFAYPQEIKAMAEWILQHGYEPLDPKALESVEDVETSDSTL